MTHRSDSGRFPAECRAFVAGLADLLDATRPGPNEVPPHAGQCARCRALLAAAERHASLLRQCARPPVPATIRSPAFLERVYERVNHDAEARIASALRSGLGPVQAPADAVWLDVADRADLAASLRRLPETRTPGWLWARIRARIARPQRRRREPVLTPARLGLLAAAGLLTGLLMLNASDSGTGVEARRGAGLEVRFEVRTEPFDSSFSLDSVFDQR